MSLSHNVVFIVRSPQHANAFLETVGAVNLRYNANIAVFSDHQLPTNTQMYQMVNMTNNRHKFAFVVFSDVNQVDEFVEKHLMPFRAFIVTRVRLSDNNTATAAQLIFDINDRLLSRVETPQEDVLAEQLPLMSTVEQLFQFVLQFDIPRVRPAHLTRFSSCNYFQHRGTFCPHIEFIAKYVAARVYAQNNVLLRAAFESDVLGNDVARDFVLVCTADMLRQVKTSNTRFEIFVPGTRSSLVWTFANDPTLAASKINQVITHVKQPQSADTTDRRLFFASIRKTLTDVFHKSAVGPKQTKHSTAEELFQKVHKRWSEYVLSSDEATKLLGDVAGMQSVKKDSLIVSDALTTLVQSWTPHAKQNVKQFQQNQALLEEIVTILLKHVLVSESTNQHEFDAFKLLMSDQPYHGNETLFQKMKIESPFDLTNHSSYNLFQYVNPNKQTPKNHQDAFLPLLEWFMNAFVIALCNYWFAKSAHALATLWSAIPAHETPFATLTVVVMEHARVEWMTTVLSQLRNQTEPYRTRDSAVDAKFNSHLERADTVVRSVIQQAMTHVEAELNEHRAFNAVYLGLAGVKDMETVLKTKTLAEFVNKAVVNLNIFVDTYMSCCEQAYIAMCLYRETIASNTDWFGSSTISLNGVALLEQELLFLINAAFQALIRSFHDAVTPPRSTRKPTENTDSVRRSLKPDVVKNIEQHGSNFLTLLKRLTATPDPSLYEASRLDSQRVITEQHLLDSIELSQTIRVGTYPLTLYFTLSLPLDNTDQEQLRGSLKQTTSRRYQQRGTTAWKTHSFKKM